MAAARPPFEQESPLARLFTGPEHHQDSSPTSRLSGPGTSRQARRLQLRNQKFRGATMPARKPSPSSCSPDRRSSAYSSDAENYSPVGYSEDNRGDGRVHGHGVLQELGNSSVHRHGKSSSKHRSSSSFDRITAAIGFGDALSPTPPSSTFHVSPTRSRNRMMTQRAYRAVSEETTAYIDHLEAQLAAAHAQAASLEAVNTNRDQSARVRTLSVEVRNLQEIITAWETQFEQRVHEAVSTYAESESGLRAQIRTLENNRDESTYRIAELEEHLSSATNGLQAVELANTNLEKRLEIMTSLLAASPTRLDFQTESPERGRRSRPLSLVAGYFGVNSSQASPQRDPQRHQPLSPNFSTTSSSVQGSGASPETTLETSELPHLTEKPSFVSTVPSSDAASIFSEAAPSVVDSIASVEVPEDKPQTDPWLAHGLWSARAKAGRRMRRFGAGSICPKPLILPSTNQAVQLSPAFAFATPAHSNVEATWVNEDGDLSDFSPCPTASIANTEAFEAESPALTNTTENLQRLYHDESSAETCEDSQTDTRARVCSQNLMQELAELDSSDTSSNKTFSNRSTDSSSPRPSKRGRPSKKTNCTSSATSVSRARGDSSPPLNQGLFTTSVGLAASTSCESVPSPISYTFADLWSHPSLAIRHIIRFIQSQLCIPKAILDYQWAAVGVLLGPLAQRRLLCQPPPSRSDASQWRLLDSYNSSGISIDNGLTSRRPDTACMDSSNPTQECDCSTPVATRKQPARDIGKAPDTVLSLVGQEPRVEEPASPHLSTYGPWLWLKFSFTLAVAVGIAFKDGPGSLMMFTECICNPKTAQPIPAAPTPVVVPMSAPTSTSRSWTKKLRRRRTFSPTEDSESD